MRHCLLTVAPAYTSGTAGTLDPVVAQREHPVAGLNGGAIVENRLLARLQLQIFKIEGRDPHAPLTHGRDRIMPSPGRRESLGLSHSVTFCLVRIQKSTAPDISH